MSGVPIETAIAAMAKEFAAAGRMLDVERAAFGLESTYPKRHLTPTKSATACDAALQSGTAISESARR